MHLRDNRPVANYSVWGSGTVNDPARITFNINNGRGPGLAVIRQKLPSTVTLEEAQRIIPGFVLRGKNAHMSRSDLLGVFLDLVREMNWRPRHFA